MPTEPDLTPEALEALQERLGGVEVPETMHGDNLAILLCSFFEDAEGEINDNGWTDAAIAGQDAVLTAIRAHYEPAFRTITALRAQLAKAEQHSEKSRALLDIAVAEYERRLATARADAVRDAAEAASEADSLELALHGPAKIVERILALIDTPTPSAPSPEAVARAALLWAAKCIECGCRHGVCEYPAKCPENEVAELVEAASDPATLAAIVAKAGGGE